MNNRRRAWFKSKQSGVLSFISTWRTTNTSTGSSASNQVKLPLISTGTYNFVVNWGDGNEDTITVWNQAETTHTYGSSGTYTITITGTIEGWYFSNTGDRLKITDISNWGVIRFLSNTSNSQGVFWGCSNLDVSATDLPVLPNGLTQFFRGCSSLIGNSSFNNWDVSAVTHFGLGTLNGIFAECTNFNQPIGNWNTSSAINMGGMFHNASLFNQNIGSWDVSNVTTFLNIFTGATAFNNGGSADINNWSPSLVTNFGGAFQNASNFNQPIGGWDVTSATSFLVCFNNATSFNQNIGAWNVSNVINMNRMFAGASAFNNGGSDTIKNWDVSKVTDFGSGFIQGMFYNATSFNQPIGNWSINQITNVQMRDMLRNASAFNQDIGSWNMSKVTNLLDFMSGKTAANYSTSNLDSIYNGWTNNALNTGLNIGFNTIKYTAAATAARALLTRANSTVTVNNAVNNGSGLIRITTGAAHGRTTGDKIFISGVTGTTEANGGWIVTVIDATTVDLQSSTFTNTYVSGGTFRIGYGWTITDGGL